MKNTKILYPAPGQIILFCTVTSIVRGKKFSTHNTGTNSMYNVHRDYKSKVENAKINAIYKHRAMGGASSAIVTVNDYEIRYFTDIAKIKRKEINGRQYSVAIDKKTKKEKKVLRKKADIK